MEELGERVKSSLYNLLRIPPEKEGQYAGRWGRGGAEGDWTSFTVNTLGGGGGVVAVSGTGHRGLLSPPPSFSKRSEDRKKSYEGGNYPPPPHWDRREMLPNHIKFRTCNYVNSPFKRRC
jgi:hypothetical protein